MKKNLVNWVVCLFFALALSSCLGDDPFQKQKQADAAAISQYVNQKALTGQTTTSGLFYAITQRSSNTSATIILPANIVELDYELYTLDDNLISSQKSYTFKPATGSFFAGLSEGVLFLKNKENEKATLLLPSALALGNNLTRIGTTTIPSNTPLRLDISIVAVRADEAAQEVHEKTKIEGVVKTVTPATLFRRDTLDKAVFFVRTKANTSGALLKDKTETTVTYNARRLGETAPFESKNVTFNYDAANTQNSGLPRGLLISMRFMRIGETSLTYMTSSMAFRDTGISGVLAPYTPVVYEITEIKQ
jgi:hypothetical protein